MERQATDRVPYTGMPAGRWFPPTPQLIKDASMLIAGYKADPDALQTVLPPGLEPHANGLVQMNMYIVPDANQTSGFGSFSLAYLTIEIADHDSLATDGSNADSWQILRFLLEQLGQGTYLCPRSLWNSGGARLLLLVKDGEQFDLDTHCR